MPNPVIPKWYRQRALPEWMNDAACLGLDDPDIMFPSDHHYKSDINNQGPETRRALRVCNQCPVTMDCMTYAARLRLSVGEYFAGVWGGRPASWYTPDRARMIIKAAAKP